MGNPLWAPWRMEYILSSKNQDSCIFCGLQGATSEELRARLVVCRCARASVMLNRYPFAAGHLLVVPHAHVGSLDELGEADHDALFRLVRACASRLVSAVKAEGLNIGCNLGVASGAGVAAHLHVHVVPRWSGDTNFMPVIGDVRVIPQALADTRDYLAGHFADLEGGSR